MDAIEFVKKFGIDRVKLDLSIVDNHGCNSLFTEDFSKQLKQILDAFEFVEKNNGLNPSKNTLKLLQSSIDIGLYHGINDVDAKTEIPKLKQAIELVEKCNES